MVDPGSVEPLFVSLRTTAALTGPSTDAFGQILHDMNAVLNVRAGGGDTSSEMYKSTVSDLQDCIVRNERSMYGTQHNIAFLNFAKSFAALSDIPHALFGSLTPQYATSSETSHASAPPILRPISRSIYSNEDDNSIDDASYRRPSALSPHYQLSSPNYELAEVKSEVDSEREIVAAVSNDDALLSLFPPAPVKKASSSSAKPPAAKKIRTDPPEEEVCPYCEFKSACPAHVTKHVRIDHPDQWTDFASVGCRSCDYRCRSSHTLKKHIRAIHGDSWQQWISQQRLSFPAGTQCPYCDEAATDIHTLCIHVVKHHTGAMRKEDPYIGCDACEETFNWAADLYAHWTRQHSPCNGYARLLQTRRVRSRVSTESRENLQIVESEE